MAGYPTPRKWFPKNKDKYAGNVNNIIARSSWEIKFMNWCDMNDLVTNWISEEIIIPYISPVDKKSHRYFCDFLIKVKTNSGIKMYLVEIKPLAQTMPPKAPDKPTKRYLNESKTYAVNQAKWKAATEFCRIKGWEFMVLTEKHLYQNTK